MYKKRSLGVGYGNVVQEWAIETSQNFGVLINASKKVLSSNFRAYTEKPNTVMHTFKSRPVWIWDRRIDSIYWFLAEFPI